MKPIFLTMNATEFNDNGEIVLTKTRFDSISQRIYDSGVVDGKNLALADLYRRHHENLWNLNKESSSVYECSAESLGKKSTLIEMIKRLPADELLHQFVINHIKETDTFKGILANAINELLIDTRKSFHYITKYEGTDIEDKSTGHTHNE